jgi:AraC-like DNA-binding protein
MSAEMFLSTDKIEPGLRNDYWRKITRPIFETQIPEGSNDTTLEGSLSSRLIAGLLVSHATFNSHSFCRDQRVIRHSGLDDYYLLQSYPDTAVDGDCEGQAMTAHPGDIAIFDLAREWKGLASIGSSLSVALSREQLDKVAGRRSLHGVVIKTGSPVTRLLSDFIVSLYELPRVMDQVDALAIEQATFALLAATLGRRAFDDAPNDPALSHVLRRRVLEFIDANLSKPGLGPNLLMNRFRVSRAHLYRMFATDGGVMTVIRDRRLYAAYRELTRPGGPSRSITEISHELGFSSSNHFLRAFRARFDMTPSEARQEGASCEIAGQRLSGIQAHFAKYAK